MFFSIVIPVYNRPHEVRELLESLKHQDYQPFEVIIVEDGSSISCKQAVDFYREHLNLRYFYQENQGQGFARNYGMRNAVGDYMVLFDSDCIVPPHFLSTLARAIKERSLDAHGGPDDAAWDFSIFQKAINFSMTSLWTTGGIRGKLKDPAKYQARGYNMGMSKEVFLATNGFIDPNKGEDIEISIRIKKMGFCLELVEEAYVLHKRKNTLGSFFAQSFSFGRNRVNVSRYHPGAVKLVHFLPLLFLLGGLSWAIFSFWYRPIFYFGAYIFGLWTCCVLFSATIQNRSLPTGLMAVLTSFGQLFFYGAGLLYEGVRKQLKG